MDKIKARHVLSVFNDHSTHFYSTSLLYRVEAKHREMTEACAALKDITKKENEETRAVVETKTEEVKEKVDEVKQEVKAGVDALSSQMGTLQEDVKDVKFLTPTTGGVYQDVECTHYGYSDNGNHNYYCAAEVTQYVTQSGDYWLGNITSREGASGYYGAWALLVVYQNDLDVFTNVLAHEEKVTGLINDLVYLAIDEDGRTRAIAEQA